MGQRDEIQAKGFDAMKATSREMLAAVAIGLAAVPVTASAAEPGRYVMEKTDQGFIRMDTQTGEMSICEDRDGRVVCKLAADERTAFQDQIDRLEERVSRLEERVGRTVAVPSEEEINRGLDSMEQFFRRFLGIVKEFDEEQSQGQEAPGGRT